MIGVRSLFATRVYEGSLAADKDFASFNGELKAACAMLAAEDEAGKAWSKANG